MALLHKEIVAILALPDVKAEILAVGLEPATNTPEQFTEPSTRRSPPGPSWPPTRSSSSSDTYSRT